MRIIKRGQIPNQLIQCKCVHCATIFEFLETEAQLIKQTMFKPDSDDQDPKNFKTVRISCPMCNTGCVIEYEYELLH